MKLRDNIVQMMIDGKSSIFLTQNNLVHETNSCPKHCKGTVNLSGLEIIKTWVQ